MNEILIIIIITIISFGVFKLIKKICNPIKNLTAIILIIPTVATCGIALLIYKFFKNNFEIGGNYHNTNTNNTYSDIPTFDEPKKEQNKKVARSFNDGLGKTMYYDNEGNLLGASMDNGLGKTTFTDNEGNYVGEELYDKTGHSIYTDKNGNINSSITDYHGDKTFNDGTKEKKDSSGNSYYS